jgi:hypothetical protein
MTVPNERTRALVEAKEFLRALLDPKKTPRVPKIIRRSAYFVLKHYPAEYEIKELYKKLPKIFGKYHE